MKKPLALTILLALAACADTTTPAGRGGGAEPAPTGSWALVSARDAQGQRIEALFPDGAAVHTLRLEGDEARVDGGCNTIMGEYRIDAQGRLLVEEIMSTRVACGGEGADLTTADTAVANLLGDPMQWSVTKGETKRLQLDHRDGSTSEWAAE
ncbi:MAG TPA: META domain-containing protein [Polyangiaceae bacterium]|nr:META domain-containing protein [Polyangiaceae bacterium]